MTKIELKKYLEECFRLLKDFDFELKVYQEDKKKIEILVGPVFEKYYSGYILQGSGHFGFFQVLPTEKEKYQFIFSKKIQVLDNTERLFVEPLIKTTTKQDIIDSVADLFYT